MKRRFEKPALSYAAQVERLQQRGMLIDDPAHAAFYLQHLNYYRLGAYWLPFEADHGSHRFQTGTRFSQVLALYVFDRELRLLVLDAIERIEISVRSQWAYQMAHRYGPHGYLDRTLARRPDQWERDKAQVTEEVQRSKEIFIQHLVNTYQEPLPPVWAACEVLSLGLLSRLFGNLKPMPVRRAIAEVYGIDEKVLASWLHHLTHVRNVCAHHSRLWNREFTITAMQPKHKPRGLAAQWAPGSRKLYNSLVVLLHCMDVVAPLHHWRGRLCSLLAQDGVDLGAMGFPAGWERMPIWSVPTHPPTANTPPESS